MLCFAGDGEYEGTVLSYYAKDVQDVKPTCILKPKTSEDVAKAIKALNTDEGRAFPVAVRSGGHAPYASNNVKDGVTIDLGKFNSVTYKGCKSGSGTAFVGSGARWNEVCSVLEPKGIMVGGGREGHVGVGGFLLGGGKLPPLCFLALLTRCRLFVVLWKARYVCGRCSRLRGCPGRWKHRHGHRHQK